MVASIWKSLESPLAAHIKSKEKERLAAYAQSPSDILEHANIERATAQGGYGRRQIYELVQNGADALVGFPNGRIEVLLTREALYCANEGEPITLDGVDTILASHVSKKRGTEIGRFGLGFKSVLGVSERPEFYSRSGSFGFDPQISERLIREIQPDAQKLPRLRIAQPLCPLQMGANDEFLADLMTRSSTVVKLPLSRGLEWLRDDLREFPAEFLLFSPHVGTLVLRDESDPDQPRKRVLGARAETETNGSGERVFLEVDGQTQEWSVYQTTHRPSEAAKEDGGELADREELPIMWAVPHGERPARSKFWAFFPTENFSTLSGILNAPWKTNEDRQNVLVSRFNDELLGAAAQLVVESVPHLIQTQEPCRFLELLPSLNDPPCEADRILGREIYARLAQTACLPDQNGTLQTIGALHLHPPVAREALDIWASHSQRPSNWVHPSVERQHPRARAVHLLRLAFKTHETLENWLGALVVDRSLNASACALRAAAAALKADPKLRESLNRAPILKTRKGDFVAPQPGLVFLARTDGSTPQNSPLTLVHPDLASRAELKDVWEILGIGEVESTSQLESLLHRIARASESGLRGLDWEAFWKTVRGVPIEIALAMMREQIARPFSQLRVKTQAGTWQPMGKTLLPGAILSLEDEADWGALVDMAFHSADEAVLKTFGATDKPKPGCAGGMDELMESYHAAHLEEFYESLEGDTRPQRAYLNFAPATTTGPLDVYLQLQSEAAKVRFCGELLLHAFKEDWWKLRHDTRREYTPLDCQPPSIWLLWQWGLFPTSQGPRPRKDCFSPAMAHWSAVLPVAQISPDAARELFLTNSFEEFKDDELSRACEDIEKRIRKTRDTRLLAEFYTLLAERGIVLDEILCRRGSDFPRLPRGEVWIESDPEKIALIISDYPKSGVLHCTPSQIKVLNQKWGLKRSSFQYEIVAARSDEPTPLLDRFSGFYALAEKHPDWELEHLELVPCTSLSRDTLLAVGRSTKTHEFLRDGHTLFYLDHLTPETLLARLVETLGLPLDEAERGAVLGYQTALAGKEKLLEVRRAQSPAAKLLVALGHKAIRARLPFGLEKADGERLQAQGSEVKDQNLRVAELALAVYGVDTLHEFRLEFERAGLEPPARWAGSHAARKWVAMLGFDAVYAGFEGQSLSRLEEVDGPPELPAAHAYQATMMTAIRLLNAQDGGSKRGLLSLPTGAGKTRTAVEALVDAIKEDGLTRASWAGRAGRVGPILWIAQSEELCEQAVVTWKWVWRAKGTRERLTISRLWSSNEADAVSGGPQVVVATIDKLQRLLANPDYEWLSRAAFVVIDEAHFAISPQYTQVLTWLGLTWGNLRSDNDRCPLLGLTATAFRGTLEETERLVKRFDSNRLDFEEWQGNPFPFLQNLGVLSRVEHEELGSQQERHLNAAQREYVERFGVLPADFERILAVDAGRNALILGAVRENVAHGPVLLFATSVSHAQTLAALLQTEGIPAAAISGVTPTATRRYAIEAFRAGKIQVLTNYNVLTTGFDAPSVRCVLIARPTYSPVLYQQMIGRGLRGPKNGGKAVCKIIDVRDNITNYGRDLAFRGFEHLWRPEKLEEASQTWSENDEIEEIFEAPIQPISTQSPTPQIAPMAESSAPETPQKNVISREEKQALELLAKRENYARGVTNYATELSRRWARIAIFIGRVQSAELKKLESLPESEFKKWQDEAFIALQKEAKIRGIRENQLPMPRG